MKIAAPIMSRMKRKSTQKLPRTEGNEAVNQVFTFSSASVFRNPKSETNSLKISPSFSLFT